jgi:hypothetical protein
MAEAWKMTEPHIEYLPLAEVNRWPRNPKQHALDIIGESMERFGFTQPLLIDESTKRIVAGHGRLDTLQTMKDSGRPAPERILEKDGEWLIPVIRGISFKNEKEAEAYLLSDNQITILGGWDNELLDNMLKDHTENLSGLGFPADKIAGLDNRDMAEIPQQTLGFKVSVSVDTEKKRDKASKLLKENGFDPTVEAVRF